MSDTNLKQYLLDFSYSWEDYNIDCLRVVDNTNNFFVNKEYKTYDLLVNKIPEELEKIFDKRRYQIKGSVGQAAITGIPWFAIMDREVTKSTMEGYYVSFLFSRNAKKLYLSIALGATQFEERYGTGSKTTEKIIKAKIQFSQDFKQYAPSNSFDDMDLEESDDKNFIREYTSSIRRRADYYEGGTFFTKVYDLQNNNFIESEFLDDIKRYVESYRKIVLDPTSSVLLEVLDETVLKESDKNQNLDLNYEIDEFSPNIIDANSKTKKKQKSNNSKRNSKPSKKVGDAGEQYVYDYEKNKLITCGQKDLADKIVKQYDDLSSFPGYDIQSFDKDGNKIFIEVKSTKTKKKSYFEISENEINAAKRHGKNYHIYHVTDALINPKITRVIKDPISYVSQNKIVLEPIAYKLIFDDNI